MKSQSVWQRSLGFVGCKPVIVETSDAMLTSDAGLLPIRQFDEKLGFTQQFADALHDSRDARFTRHSFLQMTRSRIFGILADYEDQNDHDLLRDDPVFRIIAGGSIDSELASQPTHSRFENAINIPSLNRLRDVLIDQFIASFDSPPLRLTLDIDTFADPAHGQQQLVLFHGHYDQYQYLPRRRSPRCLELPLRWLDGAAAPNQPADAGPRVITCADNDLVIMPCLLYGSAKASLGAADDITYLVGRLREVWPDIDIELRADSGFGMPDVFDECDRLRIWYSIGFGMNSVLNRNCQELLDEAVAAFEETGETQRRFTSFAYQSGSWPYERRTIVKCEVNAIGTNRRAVVTNRRGASLLPGATYDEYVDRGESENRNKELKCGLKTDRLSDHRDMANLFRLFLHVQAYNLLVRIRREIAAPPREIPPDPDEDDLSAEPIPTEALSGQARKRFANLRRRVDPLGEGHPATWRTRVIKVAAEVVERSRCIRIRLSSTWPYLDHFATISAAPTAFALGHPQQE